MKTQFINSRAKLTRRLNNKTILPLPSMIIGQARADAGCVMACGGKAGAATPLSDVLKLNKKEHDLARESGVALRFPPHSMTRLIRRTSWPASSPIRLASGGFCCRQNVGRTLVVARTARPCVSSEIKMDANFNSRAERPCHYGIDL